MASFRENNASRSRNEARFTHDVEADGDVDREGSYIWKDRNCQIMLELVIGELKADDYSSRLPNVAARKRIETKLFESTGDKNVFWDPEIKNIIAYLHKLWQTNSQLINCTGISVDQSTGQIMMPSSWWNDRIAEYGKGGKFVRILQKKPLPFKDLLDQIFGEHDVEQDERYSLFTYATHLRDTQTQTPQSQSSQPSSDVINLDGPNDEPQQSTRKTTSTRPPRRKANFETQVETGFQRVIDTRTDLLEELRSRKIQKLSYGDATAILEKLPIEQLGKFWWTANNLLKNDADVREAIIKFESEEIKIKYLETLVGVDRFGIQCNYVNVPMRSNIMENSQQLGSNVSSQRTRQQISGFNMDHTTANDSDFARYAFSHNFGENSASFKTSGTDFTTLLEMSSSKLGESSMSNLLDGVEDDNN